MRRLTAIVVAYLSVAVAGSANAQDFSGTFSTPTGTGGTLTLVLRQNAQGQVTGTLTGSTQFQVQAQLTNGQVRGYAVAPGGRLYLQGQLQEAGLMLSLAEVGPDGQPQAQTARTVMMSRAADGTAGAPRAAAPAAPSDPYVGTFSDGNLAITLSRAAQGYTGTATSQGQQLPLVAQRTGDRLVGQYLMNGVQLPFQATVQGDEMVLALDDGTVRLQRTAGAGAPGGGSPFAAPGGGTGATGAGSGLAATPQDQQIAQLLLSSPWCYFNYTSVPGSSSSGRTNTERVVFQRDGTGVQSTGGESYYSNPYGSSAGQATGGQGFQWRVQGGMLVISGDGAQWQQIPLQITRNSNGYPIVTAGGKEYATCN